MCKSRLLGCKGRKFMWNIQKKHIKNAIKSHCIAFCCIFMQNRVALIFKRRPSEELTQQ